MKQFSRYLNALGLIERSQFWNAHTFSQRTTFSIDARKMIHRLYAKMYYIQIQLGNNNILKSVLPHTRKRFGHKGYKIRNHLAVGSVISTAVLKICMIQDVRLVTSLQFSSKWRIPKAST